MASMVAGAAATAFVAPLGARTPGASTPQALRGSQSTQAPGVSLGTAALGTASLAAVASLRKRSGRAARVVRQQAPPTVVAERKADADLSGALPDCPKTIWNADDIEIKNIPAVKNTAPLIIDAAELGDELQKGKEKEWVAAQKEKIMAQLQAGFPQQILYDYFDHCDLF